MKAKIIEAKRPWLRLDFDELSAFRWVFVMLILRDIKLRYKQTFLGVAWVILQPLMTAGLCSLVFGHFLQLSSEGVPYLVFVFCGLIPWLVFSGSLQRANTCLINDTRLITKVYFPRIYIPLSATFGVGIDFLIGLFLMGIFLFYYGIGITSQIFFLPLCTLVLFIFCSGLNLFFSSVNVYFRDFKHVVPFLLQFWMFASPLAYSTHLIPATFRFIYSLNPMVGIIDSFRWSLLGLTPFPFYSFSFACLTSFLLLFFGTIIFRKIEPNFADVI